MPQTSPPLRFVDLNKDEDYSAGDDGRRLLDPNLAEVTFKRDQNALQRAS